MGVSNTSQWQIQDFPKGRGAPTPEEGAPTFLFDNNVSKNCMKMKEIALKVACVFLSPTLDLPLQAFSNTEVLGVGVTPKA